MLYCLGLTGLLYYLPKTFKEELMSEVERKGGVTIGGPAGEDLPPVPQTQTGAEAPVRCGRMPLT